MTNENTCIVCGEYVAEPDCNVCEYCVEDLGAENVAKAGLIGPTASAEVVGYPPQSCNLCNRALTDLAYDAKTIHGPWGWLCHQCFVEAGKGLGKGLGQRYEREAESGGRWIKTAG